MTDTVNARHSTLSAQRSRLNAQRSSLNAGLRFSLTCLLLGAFAGDARHTGAASAETARRVAEVRAEAAKHKSVRLEVLPPPEGEIAQSVGRGTIVWAPPHFYRVDSVEPVSGVGLMKRVSGCDGRILWSYLPEKNVAYTVNLATLKAKWSEADLVKRGVLMSPDPFQGMDAEAVKFHDTERVEGVECYVFEVPPPSAGDRVQSVQRMLLWIGAKDGVVRIQESLSGIGESLGRKRMKLLATDFVVSPQDFAFSPPAGCDVKDVTEKVMMELEAKKAAGSP